MISTGALVSLGEVLQSIASVRWTHALYVKGPRPWLPSTESCILDPDETDSPDEDPSVAKENGLTYALMVQDARAVVENLQAQRARPTTQGDLVEALNYYMEHDAFLNEG